MNAPIFRGRVSDDGKLETSGDTKRALAVWMASLAGESVDVVIRKHRNQRSIAQNARYFALLSVGSDSLWGDRSQAGQLHEDIAQTLLGLPPDPVTGGERRERTPSLNTAEFGAYMDRVVDKLIELGADLSAWDEEARKAAAA